MAAIAKAKSGAGYNGKMETVEVTYDFAADGGAIGALDMFTALQDLVIHRVIAKVNTTCAGATATVSVGKSGDAAGLMAATAVASLVAGAVIDSHVGGYKLASGGIMQQSIATAALTAGKITYVIEYSKF